MNDERVSVFDGAGDVRPGIFDTHPRTAAALEDLRPGGELDLSGDLEGFRPEPDPAAALNEELRLDPDPAPHLSDEELYRRWKEAHDA